MEKPRTLLKTVPATELRLPISSIPESKKFCYRTGALEESFNNEKQECILYQYGIREHVCEFHFDLLQLLPLHQHQQLY